MKVEISIGELLDKLTILELKKEKISDSEKVKNIEREYNELSEIYFSMYPTPWLIDAKSLLKEVNSHLWDIENKIREKEQLKLFDSEFIDLARKVYILNDKRGEIKREINTRSGSRFVEEKQYSNYTAT